MSVYFVCSIYVCHSLWLFQCGIFKTKIYTNFKLISILTSALISQLDECLFCLLHLCLPQPLALPVWHPQNQNLHKLQIYSYTSNLLSPSGSRWKNYIIEYLEPPVNLQGKGPIRVKMTLDDVHNRRIASHSSTCGCNA
jgi:hypothetical protein